MKELIEKKYEKIDQAQEIVNKAKIEKRALTPEEAEQFDKLKKEIEMIKKTIGIEEEMDNMEEKEEKKEPKEKEEESTEEERDIKAFASYIRSQVSGIETRDASNLTKGDNGAVIPKTIVNKIIEKVEEISPVYQLATKYNIAGTVNIPKEDESTDKITVAYATEFTDLTSHSNKFSTIELTGYLYGALTKISKSLLKNSDFNLTNWVVEKMSKKIAQFIENELLNGTASKVQGISNTYDSTNMKVTLASKSSITGDELIDLQEKIPDVYQSGAIWIMNKATRTAIRKLKNQDGDYLLNRDLSAQWGYTLLGKDVYCSDNVSALGDGAKNVVYYGDFSGLAVKESEQQEIQILNELFATQHAIGVVAWGEIDAKVEDTQKIAVASTPASASV